MSAPMHPLWPQYVSEVVPGLPERLVADRLDALLDGVGDTGAEYVLRQVTEPAIRTWVSWLRDDGLTDVAADLGLCLSFGAWQAARAGRAG